LCNLYCAMSNQTNIKSYELEKTVLINNDKSENARLYIGKVFENWVECDSFMGEWGRNKGLTLLKIMFIERMK
ncbi:46298_t:CDS:1, partial [Gigaspora margarita]